MKKRLILPILFIVSTFVCVLFCSCGQTQTINGYDIKVSLDGSVLSGSEDVFFYNNTENTFSELKFNLHANAFRKDDKFKPINSAQTHQAYYQGESFGGIEIKSVSSADNTLEYSITGEDENILCVILPKEIYPNESVSVTIEYTINLANVIARTGINRKAINLANFYPILCGIDDQGFYECLYYSSGDPYYSDCANYNVEITAPSEYVIASSGELCTQNLNGEKTTSSYVLKSARSFTMVLSKEFKTLSKNLDGVEIKYYYLDDEMPEKSLETAGKSLKYFTETFGEYRYPTYSVVETEFIQGGMEFPALVMISDSLESASYQEVIVHETAHQWWAMGVGNNEIEYGFLDEGLAEYSVVMFYENYAEYGYSRQELIDIAEKTYKTYCTVYQKLFGGVDTTMVRSLKDYKSEYEYVNIAYVKSCIMYENLRRFVGDENFNKCLKRYYENYCFKNVRPEDLIGAFEPCNNNVVSFFDSFLNGKVIL